MLEHDLKHYSGDKANLTLLVWLKLSLSSTMTTFIFTHDTFLTLYRRHTFPLSILYYKIWIERNKIICLVCWLQCCNLCFWPSGSFLNSFPFCRTGLNLSAMWNFGLTNHFCSYGLSSVTSKSDSPIVLAGINILKSEMNI